MTNALATRIAQEHQAAAAPPSSGFTARRGASAIEALTTRGLPTSRDENWKYANLRPLERARFTPPATPEAVSQADLPPGIKGYARYTFVDGAFSPELSSKQSPSGITVLSLRDAPDFATAQRDADERFALVNDAFSKDGAQIIASESDAAACLEVIFVATADAQAASSYPRIEIQASARARLGVIERHVSVGSDANLINGVLRIDIAPGAHVDHYRLQQTGRRATWIDTLTANVAEDGDYQLHLVNLGAASARSTMHVTLSGARARVGLHATSVGDGLQVHDAYALIEHSAPDTLSRQAFRGIGAGRSRVAFNSKVVVREAARGSDSHQSLRGLLAGTDAEVDVRPQLEIYTDDVRCAHGATAGKLDDAMLFYLLSRGIDRETAQVLLKWAFLEDVVSRIAVPELRRQVEQSLAGQMNEADALGGLL